MNLDEHVAQTAAAQHGLVTQAQLTAAGMTRSMRRHRLQERRLLIAAPRVFAMPGCPSTWRQRLLCAALSACAVVSHESAAALLGIPGFDEGTVQITVARGSRLDVTVDRHHQTNLLWPSHTRMVDSIPVTTYARTLFDLGAIVHPLRAERALDTCLARRWVTLPALWTVLIDLAEHGRAGTVAMRQLLQARGPGYVAPASRLEADFLALTRSAGLPDPAREIALGDADGWIGSVEFVWRPERVLAEVDGDWFHTSLSDRRHDAHRDQRFHAAGWTVLRLPYDLIASDPSRVIRRLRAALRAAA